jgi:hypothetical protein
VGNDVHDQVRVVLDQEIEAPVLVDACLPEVPPFVVFLGAQRRVMEILQEQRDCLSKARWICGGALT